MIVATLSCGNCGEKISQYQGARFAICSHCGFRTHFASESKMIYDSVKVHVEDANTIIKNWSQNGWKVISQSIVPETDIGMLMNLKTQSYVYIVFGKESES